MSFIQSSREESYILNARTQIEEQTNHTSRNMADQESLVGSRPPANAAETQSPPHSSCFDYIMDPRSSCHRYIAMVFICMMGFGSSFCFDTPGALEGPIEDALSVKTSQFTSLYALYSWPNVFMCFFGGLLIDKILGVRLGTIVFFSFLVLGQSLFAVGAFSGHFWLMQLGRFVYGLGGESITVAQNTYIVAWFKGKEINAVFGFQNTINGAGSTLAYNTMHRLYNYAATVYPPQTALGCALTVAALTCILSFMASIILALQDKRAERILNQTSATTITTTTATSVRPASDETPISFRDATKFKSEFWILVVVDVCFYLTIFPFIAIGSKFFQTKWGIEPTTADAIDSIVYLISAISCPFFGMLIDQVGRNLFFILVAGILVLISHILLALTYIDLWIPMIMMGLGYSIVSSSLFPLLAFAVPQKQLGTAYGVLQAMQNLGLAVASNLTGILIDWKGYINVELFFVFSIAISVIFTLILLVQDSAGKGLLNKTAADRNSSEAQT